MKKKQQTKSKKQKRDILFLGFGLSFIFMILCGVGVPFFFPKVDRRVNN